MYQNNTVKRINNIIIIAIFTVINIFSPVTAVADSPVIIAECAILAEVTSGRVLFSQNADVKRYPASTTKIMTAIVILENCDISDIVTVPKEAQGVEGSSIYLEAGEKLTVLQLLYGLMLRSGNDAATALAIHCAGSVHNFAQMMNQKAQTIGCENTNFVNPSGLPSPQHYTTAYDLMLIARYAMHIDIFKKIVSSQKILIPWNGHEYDRILINENKMLYNYDGANGIKTGYTKAAGRCLVSSAERDGMTLIAIVLNSSPMYAECSKLLDYGFDNHKLTKIVTENEFCGNIPVNGGFKKSIPYSNSLGFCYPLSPNDSVSVQTELYSSSVDAPFEQGIPVGSITIILNGNIIKNIPLETLGGMKKNTFFERFKTLLYLLCNNQLFQ